MPFLRRLAVKPDPDGPGPMRFAEPGKLARLVEAAGFSHAQERSLNVPAPFRGSPEGLLASMMEIAAPFRNAAATLSEDDRRAAEREVYDNLRPLHDGTLTTVTAPVLIVTAVATRKVSMPTDEAVARRAHEIFEDRGGTDGHDLDDWLMAESELLSERAVRRARGD